MTDRKNFERILAMSPHDFIATVSQATKPRTGERQSYITCVFLARFLAFPRISSR